MKKTLLVVLVVFLLSASEINAQVVVNEVFPNPSGSTSEPTEFIELLNLGSSAITITGWKISDTIGSIKTYIFPDTILEPGVYISIRREVTSIMLNNEGDGLELRDASDVLKDSMSFSSTIQDKSWSRIPNGTGSFANNTEPSEGLINIAPPTPSPTPSPTSSPSPTNSPSPSPSPTKSPTPLPSPTKSPTPRPTRSPSPSESPSPESVVDLSVAESPSPSPQVLGASKKPSLAKYLPYFFIVPGILLVGFAVYNLVSAKEGTDKKD